MSSFTCSSATINPHPVCGTKEPYLISDSDHSVFQVLKASLSAASGRIPLLSCTLQSLEEMWVKPLKVICAMLLNESGLPLYCSNAYPVLESYYRVHCNIKHKLNVQYP